MAQQNHSVSVAQHLLHQTAIATERESNVWLKVWGHPNLIPMLADVLI